MPLLQSLIDGHPPRDDEAIVIFDDDVSFRTGDAALFPGWAEAALLDIAQPAHARGSIHAWPINGAVWYATARTTPWIEIGPVVYLSPRAQSRVLPFPPEAQMGWGIDILWSALVKEGLRLGVVDATPVMHTGALSAAYDMTPEFAQLESALTQVGATAVHDILDSRSSLWATWPKWRSRPRWSRPASGRAAKS